MKGYAVSQGEYSDYEVIAVFTDIEKAKLFCGSRTEDGDWYPPFIEEMDIDPPIEGNPDAYVYVRTVTVSEKGRVRSWDELHVEKGRAETVSFVEKSDYGRDIYRVTSQRSLSRERAEKVVQDYLAQKKYEEMENGNRENPGMGC